VQLNLGGVTAQDSEGLRRYKAGFGPRKVQLAHREFVMGDASAGIFGGLPGPGVLRRTGPWL